MTAFEREEWNACSCSQADTMKCCVNTETLRRAHDSQMLYLHVRKWTDGGAKSLQRQQKVSLEQGDSVITSAWRVVSARATTG